MCTYPKFAPHFAQLPEVGVVDLLGKQYGEIEQSREYLPMRHRIRKDISEEDRRVAPYFFGSIVLDGRDVSKQK